MSKLINKHNTDLHSAYYNRVMSDAFEEIIMKKHKWLIEFVKNHDDLDFQTGFDQKQSKSWFSVYRGTGRILQISYNDKSRSGKEKIDADPAYKRLAPDIFQKDGVIDEKNFENYLIKITTEPKFERYYLDSKGDCKEGFYQTLIARRYTFENTSDDDFVIFDKELVIGFKDDGVKDAWNKEIIDSQLIAINNLRTKTSNKLPKDIKPDYGEFDFMGLTWDGDLIIMELKKDGSETKSSLSPIQIAFYEKQFTKLLKEEGNRLYNVIKDMILQKQRMGLIKMTPRAKALPEGLSGRIKKYIIIGNEENVSETIKKRFALVNEVFLGNDLEVFTCDTDGTLRRSSQFN